MGVEIQWMSGAAARTGNLKKIQNKIYIKDG